MVQAYNYLFFILFDNVNTSIQTSEEINSLIHGQKSECGQSTLEQTMKYIYIYIYTHTP